MHMKAIFLQVMWHLGAPAHSRALLALLPPARGHRRTILSLHCGSSSWQKGWNKSECSLKDHVVSTTYSMNIMHNIYCNYHESMSSHRLFWLLFCPATTGESCPSTSYSGTGSPSWSPTRVRRPLVLIHTTLAP